MNRKQNIILTGELRCGKSTLVRQLLKALSFNYRGIFSEPIYRHDKVLGYGLKLVGKAGVHAFAHTDFSGTQKFAQYVLDLSPFEGAIKYIEHSLLDSPPLFVVDEVGVMELTMIQYKSALLSLLDSPVPCLIVVQKRSDFLMKIKNRSDVIVLELAANNRFEVEEKMTSLLNF